jgi:hypothetical protein
MSKIFQFPFRDSHNRGFTPQARKMWEAIPANVRDLLAGNAYCGSCKGMSSMHVSGGEVRSGLLVILGYCSACGKSIRRVVD